MITSRHLRPHRALLTLALYGSLSLLPSFFAPPALAQTRTKTGNGVPSLEARLDKARRIYSGAMALVNSYPVFQVSGRVVGNRGNRLQVYGTSTNSTGRGLGWNGDDTFLIVNNADLGTLQGGRYFGRCVALGQTEFQTPPQSYYDAVAIANKYAPLVESLEREVAAKQQRRAQVALQRQQEREAKAWKVESARRASVLASRRVLLGKERTSAFARSDALVARASNSEKPRAYLESATRLSTLFNKWASLGVGDTMLLDRIVRELLTAGTMQARRGDLAAACVPVERLLSLELLTDQSRDALTARPVVSLSSSRMPSNLSQRLLRPSGSEPAEVRALADAWLEQLPLYMKSAAPPAEKARVAALSQVLVTRVFAPQQARLQVVGTALESLRGERSEGANTALGTPINTVPIAVDPALRQSVEVARRGRVEGEVDAFLGKFEPQAGTSTDPLFFRKYADEARALAAKLAPRDEVARLDAAIVVAGLRSATLWAGQGKIAESMEDARGVLWDTKMTAKMASGQKRFSLQVQTLLERDARARQGLGELMGAWTTAFPASTKKAEYSDSLLARKFGEVLLRCSGELQLPQAAGLEAALAQPIVAPTSWRMHALHRARFCQVPTDGEGTTVGDAKPAEDKAAEAPVPALDFEMRSFKTRKTSKLSDFAGKVVLLYFFDLAQQVAQRPPSPEEQLFALAKKYDPKKVVLLLVHKEALNLRNDDQSQYIKALTDPATAKKAGLTARLLPPELFAYESFQKGGMGTYGEFSQSIARFYLDSNNILRGKARVSVINAQGLVTGHVDFEPLPVSDREYLDKRGVEVREYEFDNDALESLVLDALTPKEKGKDGDQ